MRKSKSKQWKPRKPRREITHEAFEASPRGQFLKMAGKAWSTPDYQNFFMGYGGTIISHDDEIAAVVALDCPLNSQMGSEWSALNTIHLRSVSVATDLRGAGFFTTVCAYLTRFAEDTGVFIYGTAKPFRIEIPKLTNAEECLRWLDTSSGHDAMKRSRETDERCERLLETYLANGFCRYDASGYPVSDRFWKSVSFGYLGREPAGERERDYFNRHLSCC